MWQFLNFLPLPQGHGSLRPTSLPAIADRLDLASAFRSVDGRLLVAAVIMALGGGESCTALLSVHVEPTKPSSSSSMRKIMSVTRSPSESHICSKIRMPSRLYSTFGSTWA